MKIPKLPNDVRDPKTAGRALHKAGWVPVQVWLPEDVAKPILKRYLNEYREKELAIRRGE